MTRSALRFSFFIIPLVAAAFAVPAFAATSYDHDWSDDNRDNDYYNRDHSRDDRDDRNGRDRIPSCTISAQPNTTGYGGQVRLTWDSTDADYAGITDLGRVEPDGSRYITVYTSKTYYMTVYNDGRTSECSTLVNIPGDKHVGGYYPPYYGSYGYNYGYGQPSCTITLGGSYGSQRYLSWTSYGATSAYLSGYGSVAPSGSQLTSGGLTGYTLTVYGPNGSASCTTGGQYAYPYTYQTPSYVALTQIPYTGFDFGPVGNAIYWTTLIALAIGAAYLLVYQQGLRALSSIEIVDETMRAGRMQYQAMRNLMTGRMFARAKTAQRAAAPAMAGESAAPVRRDAMQVVEGDQPRIIISRE